MRVTLWQYNCLVFSGRNVDQTLEKSGNQAKTAVFVYYT